MIKMFLVFFILAYQGSAYAASTDSSIAECQRAKAAKFNLVYLHGLDPKNPSSQELQNRQMLATLATKHHANLAILRSHVTCKNDMLCWPHSEPALHEKLYQQMLKTMSTCTDSTLPIVLLGFSNGGYFAAKSAVRCFKGVDAVIASGSAGQLTAADKPQPANCAPIYLTIGEGDLSRKKAEAYAASLKAKGYTASLTTFKGRHELSKNTLDQMLNLWSNKQK